MRLVSEDAKVGLFIGTMFPMKMLSSGKRKDKCDLAL
jgi:hypothetical protein